MSQPCASKSHALSISDFRSLAFLFASAIGSFGDMSTSDRSPHTQWSFGQSWLGLGMGLGQGLGLA